MPLGFALLTLVGLALLYRVPPSAEHPSLRLPLAAGICLGGILVLVLSYGWQRMPGGAWRFPAVALLFLAAAGSLIPAWGGSGTDVWNFQQQGCQHLLRGENPYAQEYPNPFPHEEYYGPRVIRNGKIQSCPYPPLSLLLVLPGYVLASDVRWMLMLAAVAAAGFMVATGRRIGMPAGHPLELAGVSFLCQPKAWMVLENAWTEPLVLLSITAGAWAMTAGRPRLTALAVASTIFVKQYGLLWLLPAWASGRLEWRRLVTWFFAGALVTLPFIVWNARAAWLGLVIFQVDSPFRVDSLSIPAAVYLATGYAMPSAVGFVAAGLVAGVVVWRRIPGVGQTLLAGAAVALAFFVLNKSVHLNYYWLLEGLLAAATLASAAEDMRTARGEP